MKILPVLGMLVFLPFGLPVFAADLSSAPMAAIDPAPVSVREALSRYLSLEMVRATFDVVSRDELGAELDAQAVRWEGAPPSAAEIADIDQQLLAEASYYIVSLSYLVQVGGAIFPTDKAEDVYANDTLVRLDDLRRRLLASIEEGADVLPILTEVEQIRALTEGYRTVPEGFGLFERHEELLNHVLQTAPKAGATPA
ncbi:hypothetical protein [Devosia sp. CN2-171]|uniref:hypothetical protein n=1 Tax=Devosia sp. CN2-171 TaxID=3400909 RepID=UPI003BF8B186